MVILPKILVPVDELMARVAALLTMVGQLLVKAKPFKLSVQPTHRLAHVSAPPKPVQVVPAGITTAVDEFGIPLGLQLAATFQAPMVTLKTDCALAALSNATMPAASRKVRKFLFFIFVSELRLLIFDCFSITSRRQ